METTTAPMETETTPKTITVLGIECALDEDHSSRAETWWRGGDPRVGASVSVKQTRAPHRAWWILVQSPYVLGSERLVSSEYHSSLEAARAQITESWRALVSVVASVGDRARDGDLARALERTTSHEQGQREALAFVRAEVLARHGATKDDGEHAVVRTVLELTEPTS
jgi:hypothetical protein